MQKKKKKNIAQDLLKTFYKHKEHMRDVETHWILKFSKLGILSFSPCEGKCVKDFLFLCCLCFNFTLSLIVLK